MRAKTFWCFLGWKCALYCEILQLQVHEIGHALGLAHSSVYDSIMFPYYQGKSDGFALGYDDILAVYKLYSKNSIYRNTVNSRFKKDLKLQIHLHKAFFLDDRFLDSLHKSFLNQTTLDLRKEKWTFLNREFTVLML